VTPSEAAGALAAAIRADKLDDLAAIMGPESEEMLASGDEVADRAGRRRFLALYEEKSRLEPSAADEDEVILHVGNLDWPFPVPIVKLENGWVFDTPAGKEEIIDRRIGRNELDTIQVCLAFIDAENEYARQDWDKDGILEYAGKVLSSPGRRDGLYWPVNEGEEQSPLGPLIARATGEGYSASREEGDHDPYRGYFYRILKAQGPHAPGGAYEYVVRDKMIGGFAIVAYPANYGVSGLKTFIASHDGAVHEKDLGDDTEKTAREMTLFDPDPTWKKVAP
jgi:hypothetical protein